MEWLRSVLICLIEFCISSPNNRDRTVRLGYDRRVMMSQTD